jgi:hypothetical protein
VTQFLISRVLPSLPRHLKISLSLSMSRDLTITTLPIPPGNAIYAYAPLHCTPDACEVVPSCNKAAWARDIEEFNSNCTDGVKNCQIEIVNSYGGDIEFWASKDSPDACAAPASTNLSKCNVSVYFDQNNAKAAEAYKKTEGVKAITALLDGRLDGMDQISTCISLILSLCFPLLKHLTHTYTQQTRTINSTTVHLEIFTPTVR